MSKYRMEHAYTKILFVFIWNSILTGNFMFLFANVGNPPPSGRL